MVSEATDSRAEREQPQPAEGQVWVPPLDVVPAAWLDQDGTVTVGAPLSDPTLVRLGPYRWLPATELRRGRCIGVQTPHGRVMVGDEFLPGPGAAPCEAVALGAAPGSVLLRSVHGEAALPAVYLAAGEGGWTRTRYAPARVGERYASRLTPGRVATIQQSCDGGRRRISTTDGQGRTGPTLALPADGRVPVADWERLDPAPAAPLDVAPGSAFDIPPGEAGPPRPRAEGSRAALRRAIDRAIAADHGPFAPARAAALRALTPGGALDALRRYEAARGVARTPNPEARAEVEQALGEAVVAVYERCRSLPAPLRKAGV